MPEAVNYVQEICQYIPKVYELAMHPPNKEIERKALDLLRELNDLLIAFQELLMRKHALDFGEVNAILRHVRRTLEEIR
jgi:hypothetical protein